MVKNVSQDSQTLATTSGLVSEEKFGSSRRDVLTITNTSPGAETVTIGVGQEAVAGKGLVLRPGGSAAWVMDSRYNPPQHRVNALGSAATATIAIYEEVENGI